MEGLNQDSNRVQSYYPFRQLAFGGMTVVVKTSHDPMSIVSAVRQQVLAVDPDQPIYNVNTMQQLRADSIAPERLNLMLLGIFAAVALILAAVGIYGVMAYSVTQRTHEIGIRMALGARPSDVLGMVIRQGMKLAMGGLAIGIGGAWLATRAMASLLFGVSRPTRDLHRHSDRAGRSGSGGLFCARSPRNKSRSDDRASLRVKTVPRAIASG